MSQQQGFGFGGSGNNVISGTAVTVGATSAAIITLPLGSTPGTYSFEVRVAAFEATTPASLGASVFATVRTDGATATVVENPDDVSNSDPALDDAYTTITASGNTAFVTAEGVAFLTIDWAADLLFTFRG